MLVDSWLDSPGPLIAFVAAEVFACWLCYRDPVHETVGDRFASVTPWPIVAVGGLIKMSLDGNSTAQSLTMGAAALLGGLLGAGLRPAALWHKEWIRPDGRRQSFRVQRVTVFLGCAFFGMFAAWFVRSTYTHY